MSEVHGIEPASALSVEDRDRYNRVRYESDFAACSLDAAWDRPVRHNSRVERRALYFAVHAAGDCISYRKELLRPTAGDAVTRYGIEAGVRTIPELLPFDATERNKLYRSERLDAVFFGSSLCDRDGRIVLADAELELVNRWHQWLWVDDPTVRGQAPNPAAQVLQEGCRRLAGSLALVLEQSSDQ